MAGPAFWRGGFDATTAADTFLDMSAWGRGIVWINGRSLGRCWTIARASSEEARKEDGGALNAINGQVTDYRRTAYSPPARPGGTPRLIIDLGAAAAIAGLRYTQRQGPDGVTGRIRRYRVHVGDKLVESDRKESGT